MMLFDIYNDSISAVKVIGRISSYHRGLAAGAPGEAHGGEGAGGWCGGAGGQIEHHRGERKARKD